MYTIKDIAVHGCPFYDFLLSVPLKQLKQKKAR
jgi:hypothetical protein